MPHQMDLEILLPLGGDIFGSEIATADLQDQLGEAGCEIFDGPTMPGNFVRRRLGLMRADRRQPLLVLSSSGVTGVPPVNMPA